MASTFPAAKSRSLYNFSLPELKMNDGQSGAVHQRRRSVKSPSRGRRGSMAALVRQSLSRDSVLEVPPRHHTPLGDHAAAVSSADVDLLGKRFPSLEKSLIPHRVLELTQQSTNCGDRIRNSPRGNLALESGAPSSSSQTKTEKAPKNEVGVTECETKRSKILIKLSQKLSGIKEEDPKQKPSKIGNTEEEDGVKDEVREPGKIHVADEETKIWNLRPRKPIQKSLHVNGGFSIGKSNGLSVPTMNKSSGNLRNRSVERGGDFVHGMEKKEKQKLSIFVALSKEEIEEDIFSITGSKPTRKPKKRPKQIQKHIDPLLPGGWLLSITEDSYKVTG